MDSVNDAVHTVVRPTAGGLASSASADASTVTVSNPGDFFSTHQWVAVTSGVLIRLFVHVMKASARPVINTLTGGVEWRRWFSTAEDVTSAGLSLIAIIIPILVIVFLVAFVFFMLSGPKTNKGTPRAKT